MRWLANDVPIGCLAVLVVGAITGAVVVGVLLVRRVLPSTREGFDAEVSSQMLGVVASLFGLLLAFVVVIAYQSVGDARANIETEANALAAVVRDARALPAEQADAVTRATGAYVRAVTDDEWPRMREGESSPEAFAAIDGIYRALQAAEPRTTRAEAFYGDAVGQLSTALEARRDRLSDVDGGLSALLTALILVGACIILGYATLVGSRSLGFHLVGASAIAIVVGFALVVLLALSYPFSGSQALDPDAFRSGVLAQFSGAGG